MAFVRPIKAGMLSVGLWVEWELRALSHALLLVRMREFSLIPPSLHRAFTAFWRPSAVGAAKAVVVIAEIVPCSKT